MKRTREILLTALALFSLFFGAGNLILPPLLGYTAAESWWLVALGFCISAVLIPILGILAHARLQGTMFDFGNKVSPGFSRVYCYFVYAISISLPSPRTAAVTHEIGVMPLVDSSSLITSIVYFSLVFLFVINRGWILDVIGKFLSPAILLVLFGMIAVSFFRFPFEFDASGFSNPISSGILEGYQTFDAIGAVVVGGVIIISINIKEREMSFSSKRKIIARAGWLAGLGLFLIYGCLILTGALFHGNFSEDVTRTALLSGISKATLGNSANLLLSILVSLACFTTAVGIITGTADFVKSQFPKIKSAYLITSIIASSLGILMGQFNVGYIIAVALPALMFIYPITIALILLNVLPSRFTSPSIFRAVVLTTIVFSLPDFLGSFGIELDWWTWIPLSDFKMGWVLPSLIVFFALLIREKKPSPMGKYK
ncbi:MAG: branched-chain amino acid transport system II carrier protein [Flavobacteriaceae bacterium]